MKAAPHPDQEERLRVLEDYAILDSLPEKAFDDLVELASRLTGSPVSLVSLVDRDRQWFKAAKGFPDSETGLENSICAHGILEEGVVEIQDTRSDIRTADMPIVADDANPFLFYAGMQLINPEGLPLGMLCVLDHKPRALTEDQRFALKVLGDQVMAQLELRRQLKIEQIIRSDLESLLAERNLLAREIDHRMKNSLAMVTSFLNLQKRRAGNEEIREELSTAAQRVAAIGQLHEELYSSARNGQINLADFAERLVDLLGRNAPPGIRFEVDLLPVSIDPKRASAFAVIMNEFITNAFKYAFPEGRNGRIRIEGAVDGDAYTLVLSDNGVGGASAANEERQSSGLGTRIIENVGRQLGGQPELSADADGYRLSISFPVEPD